MSKADFIPDFIKAPLAGDDPVGSVEDIFDTPIYGSEVGVGQGELKHISNLVAAVRATEGLIGVWEEKVQKEKETLRTLLEVTLPEAMLAVGMSDLGLSDGSRVKVEPFHRGSITEKTKAAAHAWLEENGFGGLIKKDITVSFGKDDEGFAGLAAYIREMKLVSKEKTAVHPQTLGAFIRNQAEKGEPVPSDVFNVYSGTAAKVFKPAEKLPFSG